MRQACPQTMLFAKVSNLCRGELIFAGSQQSVDQDVPALRTTFDPSEAGERLFSSLVSPVELSFQSTVPPYMIGGLLLSFFGPIAASKSLLSLNE